MIDPPCLNCEERHLYCHSSCEGYLQWKADRQAEEDARRNSADYEYAKFACAKQAVKEKIKKVYSRRTDIY